MFHKYFTVAWDAGVSIQRETAARLCAKIASRCENLRRVVATEAFAMFVADPPAAGERLQVLPANGGAILGTTFKRDRDLRDESPCERVRLAAADVRELQSLGGRALTLRYWGHYVAFILSDGALKWAFRSPNCHQPCLYANVDGVRLYFASADDLAKIDAMPLTINWDFIAIFTAAGRVHCAETGLNEVSELQCGEYHLLNGLQTTSGFHWNAADVAERPAYDDSSFATSALRATVRSCVASWASEHERVVQRLSGGIDSSIVTACLQLAPSKPEVTCVNYYSRGTYGDERKYARAVASRNGFRLVELAQDTTYDMRRFLSFARTDSPLAFLSRLECDLREVELATQLNATARFSGNMGDILFQMPPMASVAIEYLQRKGLDARFFGLALEAAQMDRVSIWTILRKAIVEGRFQRPTSTVPGEFAGQDTMLLTKDAASRVFSIKPVRFVHPWLQQVGNVPAGKFAQISCLGANSSYFNPLHGDLESEWVHPLLSEPLVELCLRIPAYLLMHGGWDRTMARHAFADVLPDEVKNRQTKGAMTLWIREMLSNNTAFLRELLMDGILVREGIIDRKQLEAALPGTMTKSNLPAGCFLDCVAAEAWCRVWHEQRSYRAAA